MVPTICQVCLFEQIQVIKVQVFWMYLFRRTMYIDYNMMQLWSNQFYVCLFKKKHRKWNDSIKPI